MFQEQGFLSPNAVDSEEGCLENCCGPDSDPVTPAACVAFLQEQSQKSEVPLNQSEDIRTWPSANKHERSVGSHWRGNTRECCRGRLGKCMNPKSFMSFRTYSCLTLSWELVIHYSPLSKCFSCPIQEENQYHVVHLANSTPPKTNSE